MRRRAWKSPSVYASHANNVPLSLLSEAQRANLAPDDTSIVLGPADGIRGEIHERAHCVSLGRHRHTHRDEDGRERVPQGEPRSAEFRAERDVRDVGRLRHE